MAGRGTVEVVVTGAAAAAAAARVQGLAPGTVALPQGADEATVLRLLGTGVAAEAPLLRLSTAVGGRV